MILPLYFNVDAAVGFNLTVTFQLMISCEMAEMFAQYFSYLESEDIM